VLLGALVGFNVIVKWVRTRKAPTFELKILGLLAGVTIAALVVLIYVFPTTYSNYYDRISGYVSEIFSGSSTNSGQSLYDILVFVTLPYAIGLLAVLGELAKGIKTRSETGAKPVILRKTFLSWIYVAFGGLIMVLVAIPSSWQSRFVLLAYVPIVLTVPVGIKKIESWVAHKYPANTRRRVAVVATISLAFVVASFASVVSFVPQMGPSISMQAYEDLEQMKAEYQGQISNSDYIHVEAFELPYWVEYVLDRPVVSGDINLSDPTYSGYTVLEIVELSNAQGPFNGGVQFAWDPILPLSTTSVTTSGSTNTATPTQGGSPSGQFPGQPSGQQPNSPQQPQNPQQPQQPQQPTETLRGEVLYEGQSLALSIVKFENGTIA
jgi:hypothetical protein